jgi:thioredoxin 2
MNPADQPRAVVSCVFCGTANRVDLSKLASGPRCANCQKPILLDRPVKTTGGDFDRTLQGTDVPVVVDFYADWCGPCRMMAPTLDDFARQQAGRALVVKLDTDAEPAIAGRYGIRGIPTLIVFERGQERGRHVGVTDLRTLQTLTGLS